MKTTLLLTFAMFLGISVIAQKQYYSAAKCNTPQQFIESESPTTNSVPITVIPFSPKPKKAIKNEDLETIPIGSSLNGYTLTTTEQRCLWYDKNLDAIVSTFRGNQSAAVSPRLGNGNDIVSYTSTNRGETWNGKIVLGDGKGNRYPSGVLVNPIGNTNINNAINLVTCPTVTNSVWAEYCAASKSFDGTNSNVQRFQLPVDAPGLVRGNVFACEDGTVHFVGDSYEDIDPDPDILKKKNSRIIVRNGVYNPSSKNIDWEEVILPLSVHNSPKTGDAVFESKMTWTNDGSVGYIVTSGADSRAGSIKGQYPIVYKSTDKGKTWELQPYFDFSTLDIVQEHIIAAWVIGKVERGDLAIPWFNDFDITIAADGNLNIMVPLRGQYTQNTDSIAYYFASHANIFNFIYSNSTWKGHFIQRLTTLDVTPTTSIYTAAAGNVAYGPRVHAVRNYDGTKIFALWTNTLRENTDGDSADIKPDLFIWGYELGDEYIKAMHGPDTISKGSGSDGLCHFMFASPICMNIDGGLEFPVTIADIETTGYNADLPCIHNYLKGVKVMDDAFTKIIDTINATKSPKEIVAIVGGNYPNPFTGITSFDITLKKPVPVSVTVTTVTGQKVLVHNYGTVPTGKSILEINASNLKSGIYIYTVTAGDNKSSHKMIIK